MSKLAIITGASSGIGFELTKKLYNLGWTIVLACRNKKKTLEKINEISDKSDRLIYLELDLNNYDSIISFCNNVKIKFNQIDLLVNNAGMQATKRLTDVKICDKLLKINQCFMVNFLGHYILFNNLQDKVRIEKIINISSVTHWDADNNFSKIFSRENNYALSKLAMIYFTNYINSKTNINAYTVNPGYVDTSIWEYSRNKNGYLYNFVESIIRKIFSISPEDSSLILLETSLVNHLERYVSPNNDSFLKPIINEMLGKYLYGSNNLNFPDTSDLSKDLNEQKKFFDIIDIVKQ